MSPPHHQLLNVKQNPPFHQNRPGVVPCRKNKKKEKPPTSPKTGGGTPPSVKIEEDPFKKKIKKKEKKEKLVTNYFCCEINDSTKTGWGTSPPGKKGGEKNRKR